MKTLKDLKKKLLSLRKTEWIDVPCRDCKLTIQKRPNYCDRGRFTVSIFVEDPRYFTVDEADQFPRYFFFIDCLIQEMDEWLRVREQTIE